MSLIDPTISRTDLDRAALRAALAAALSQGDSGRCTVLAAALVLCIDTDGGDYTGFEAAAAALRLHRHARPTIADPALRLVADAGVLMAGAFDDLDDNALPPLAADVVRGVSNKAIPAAVRLLSAMGAASYFDARVDIEKVWWLELAVRDVFAQPDVAPRLAAEWHRGLVVACYSRGQAARGDQLRRRQSAQGIPPIAVVQLKLLLLDAYTHLGEGRGEAGRDALTRAEPLRRASAPHRCAPAARTGPFSSPSHR